MTDEYDGAIAELRDIQERLRSIRARFCDPKANENPRYHALSSAVSGLSRAIEDMENERL